MARAAAEMRVTVVIPTHHRRALLSRLLASLERQTLAPERMQVLIVHNYTDDGTETLAREWCARQPFDARYFRKNYNGPTRSRDFGAQMADGEVVAFTDDDCVATPGWLEAGLAAFLPAAAAGVRGRAAPVGLVQGKTLPMPDQPMTFPSKTIHIDGPSVFYETCNIFYLKEAFTAVGGFSPDFLDRFYGEDTDLGWKVTQTGYDAAFADEALVYHEVFQVSTRKWLAEPLYFRNLPYLIRKYPALREHMYHRYFLSRDTALFNLLLVGLGLLPFLPVAGGLVVTPYFIERFRSGGHVGGVLKRVLRVVAGLPRNGVMWWALARGSLRARRLLL